MNIEIINNIKEKIIKAIPIISTQGKDIVNSILSLLIMIPTMIITIGNIFVPTGTGWDNGMKEWIRILNSITIKLALKSK